MPDRSDPDRPSDSRTLADEAARLSRAARDGDLDADRAPESDGDRPREMTPEQRRAGPQRPQERRRDEDKLDRMLARVKGDAPPTVDAEGRPLPPSSRRRVERPLPPAEPPPQRREEPRTNLPPSSRPQAPRWGGTAPEPAGPERTARERMDRRATPARPTDPAGTAAGTAAGKAQPSPSLDDYLTPTQLARLKARRRGEDPYARREPRPRRWWWPFGGG